MTKPEPLVQALIDRRKAAGLSQRDIVTAIGCAGSTIAQLETGAASPTLRTLRAYADVVEASIVAIPAPHVDAVRVQRAINGEARWADLSPDERTTVFAALRSRGWSRTAIGIHLCVSGKTIREFAERLEAAA